MKTGIEKLLEWWDADDMAFITEAEQVIKEARRLAAEEKSGDEELIIRIPKDKRCPYRFGINITTGGCDGVIEGPAEVIVRSPAPSRTAELVRKLRELIARRYTNGVRGGWGDDIEEILRDYEGGA